MGITVIIADDHEIIREGIKTIIKRRAADIAVAGEATDGRQVLKLAERSPADVYILDISMPLLNGIDTSARLLNRNPESRIIILSMHNDYSYIKKAINCGAQGYLLKEDACDEIIPAVREVFNGGCFLSRNIPQHAVDSIVSLIGTGCTTGKPDITNREREILQLIGEGYGMTEIAGQLGLSPHTVRSHRKNIMRKLGIHRQVGLVSYALKEFAVDV